jgi:hypothetical protein
MQPLIGAHLSAMSAQNHLGRNAASIGVKGSTRWFGIRTLSRALGVTGAYGAPDSVASGVDSSRPFPHPVGSSSMSNGGIGHTQVLTCTAENAGAMNDRIAFSASPSFARRSSVAFGFGSSSCDT